MRVKSQGGQIFRSASQRCYRPDSKNNYWVEGLKMSGWSRDLSQQGRCRVTWSIGILCSVLGALIYVGTIESLSLWLVILDSIIWAHFCCGDVTLDSLQSAQDKLLDSKSKLLTQQAWNLGTFRHARQGSMSLLQDFHSFSSSSSSPISCWYVFSLCDKSYWQAWPSSAVHFWLLRRLPPLQLFKFSINEHWRDKREEDKKISNDFHLNISWVNACIYACIYSQQLSLKVWSADRSFMFFSLQIKAEEAEENQNDFCVRLHEPHGRDQAYKLWARIAFTADNHPISEVVNGASADFCHSQKHRGHSCGAGSLQEWFSKCCLKAQRR